MFKQLWEINHENIFEKLWQLEGYHQKALLAQVNLAEQTEFSFGQALAMLKLGYRVARKGWNGKGLSIELQTPDENSKMTLPYLFINYPATPASDTAPANHINARAPWLASQTDMLAEDWVLVE